MGRFDRKGRALLGMNGALYCVLANDLLLFLPGILDYGADDEVVGDGADDGHRNVGYRVLQPHDFDE